MTKLTPGDLLEVAEATTSDPREIFREFLESCENPVEVVVLTPSSPAEMLAQIAAVESTDSSVVKPAGVPVDEVERPGQPKVVAS